MVQIAKLHNKINNLKTRYLSFSSFTLRNFLFSSIMIDIHEKTYFYIQKKFLSFNMRLENILVGMTIPGVVSQNRLENMSKQLLPEEKSLFMIQNLVGEIVRLQKLICSRTGETLGPEIAKDIKSINQSAIAKAWGVNRNLFPELFQKIQQAGSLKRKKGSGTTITVMSPAIKRKLIEILIKHKGDLDFITWQEELRKDKRFTITPKRESIRK